MKLSGDTIPAAWRALFASLRGGHRGKRRPIDNEAPLRAELFSAAQMEQHGKDLAALHRVSLGRAPDLLLVRLGENEQVLFETCNVLAAAVKANRRISPAGEWLLDNLYLIEEQVRTARRHLPKGYSRELPRLAHGPSAGLPRVYDIALEAVSHGDGHVDADSLSRFVAAYQKTTQLRLGELWAIPIMLRLALIENLRRVGARVSASTTDRERADVWADEMMEVAEKDPKSLILVVADMARSNPPMASSFVAELARRLQGQSAALALPLTWIEQRLSESGGTIEQLVQSETQKQASGQVSISNSIGSLRFLAAMDWREFVETMSGVEQKLREDPGGVYGTMDFATRDHYRHAVEKIARASRLSEIEVARKAIQLAHEGAAAALAISVQAPAAEAAVSPRDAHVGCFLIGEGLLLLKRAAGTRWSAGDAVCQAARRFPLLLYIGSIGLLTLLFSAGLLRQALVGGIHGWPLATLGLLAAVGTSQLAVALVNWCATLLAAPQALPHLDFTRGIPAQCRTLVVVPTLLGSVEGIDELAEALEVRYLGNRDAHLHFALLTDFADASEEKLPQDDARLARARDRIDELNRKYAGGESDVFFLFHRPRRWNPREKLWMGYERKRGKLGELNALLRGGAAGRFALIAGNTAVLSGIKYVITLDTDTQLPRDAARQFVGAMAHPLNRPRYDPACQRVTAGYGIMQPRVETSLPGTNRSRYARLFGAEPGIDPYTRLVSDVYQDLCGEGSFIGKGIYDVDAFELALKDRFPENRILSHDLLEGCYARSALLSESQLYEEHPVHYFADVSRRHRWIRGDWQIASWLLPRVPGEAGGPRKPNPLSWLSQWKILDNLRRSIVAPALTLLLLLGWSVFHPAWFWTAVVVGIIALPPLFASALDLLHKPPDAPPRQHVAASLETLRGHLARAGLTFACLPFEAWYSCDAILRTNWRILVSHTRLLEWTPSSGVERSVRTGFVASYRTMLISPVIAAAAAAYLANAAPRALIVAAPVLFLWTLAPAIIWWLGRPRPSRAARLTSGQSAFLQTLARRTWAFFETFVSAEDHWLPPDNYQEQPLPVIAHRTSPTNIGLSLLANLAAYDFGFIPAGQLIVRTTDTLQTMQGLERYEGHFYNWYDTQTLRPLAPLYVSSVDSGNLAGNLLTLQPGLLALCDDKVAGTRWFEGIANTLAVLVEIAGDAATPQHAQLQRDVESAFDSRAPTLAAVHAWLTRLAPAAAELARGSGDAAAPDGSAQWWTQALTRQCRDALEELLLLAPWLALTGLPDRVRHLVESIDIPSLRELAARDEQWLKEIAQRVVPAPAPAEQTALDELQRCVALAGARARECAAAIERLAMQAAEMAVMDYGFLYDPSRHLLAIGYNVSDRRRDTSYYDLLASEARLASFVAIAQGQLPQENWFALGRLLTASGGEPMLLSWSGSMFEYLMPMLIMPSYENTLLERTCEAAVERQIAYATRRGVAWGISECGYNTVDAALNYQYRAFGVPGLGLKRGLAEDLVIAPYASALALMVAPARACANLERLAGEGLAGGYGLYEAVDYTAARLPRGQTSAVIRSFMAHHQGMIFLALAYALRDRPMQKRFAADPQFQATTLLLQERVPRAGPVQLHTSEFSSIRATVNDVEMPVRVIRTPDTPAPEVQLLSNSRYHVMITNAGGGYSRWKELAVTRWREDTTCDNWGAFCYLRDVSSGVFWSNTHQPTLKRAENYEAIFSEGRAEFRRRDLDYDTHTEIVVSPEDDIELRRIRITNRARTRRTIEVTTYAEVTLAVPAADALHPAFSNLFVQTEIVRERQAILCTRRPRSDTEQPPWMLHVMAVRGAEMGDISYETDRARFIGRGRTVAAPQALGEHGALSNSAGSVLDPVIAIRCRIALDPEQAVVVDVVTGVGATREAALNLAAKYQDRHLADRVFELAWTHSQVVLRQINATEADTQLYARLAGCVVYANASLRGESRVLAANRRGQSGLWSYAISGDLPIVLLQIGEFENIELVRQLVQAHAYWRLKGLIVDLVVWNEDRAGYRQLLQDQIMGLIAAGIEAHVMDKPGGIFVRRAEQISNEDRILVQAVARAIISDRRGALGDQINRRGMLEVRAPHLNLPRLKPTRTLRPEIASTTVPVRQDLLFGNGIGGFSTDGREYLIATAHGQVTPAPWVNVLANPYFGSVISESGMSYTWSENAHEYRLTPWNNDPVSDSGGEAFYIRDEESGHFWSPAPAPCRGAAPYLSRHGFGYSTFEYEEGGIRSELTVYVALDAAVKFSMLKISNTSGRARRLSATGYVEWVLGDLQPKTSMHVITETDPVSGGLCARNSYNTEFAERTAFFDVDDAKRTFTGDRAEFIGRNGTLRNPAAMLRTQLSNKVGAGLDPCAAIQLQFDIAHGEQRNFVFRLGAGRNLDDARQLMHRCRGGAAANDAFEKVRRYWQRTLGAVQVDTPDPALNVLANGWLVYQILASRLWARSGFYQSGGAFGFRDQLQDTMALVHSEPALLREQLLRCAAHQFREGDVQHWWHPPSDRGVRTHCSDDYLWLPLALCRYVFSTGDTGVLDEPVPLLEGRPVNPEEDSYYDLPGHSSEAISLYAHGVRAIEHGLSFGVHGLPLMGTGDWNDGMNLVGAQGKGESVWLGFFLYEVLMQFTRLAQLRGDGQFAERCQREAAQLRQNVERDGWDGEWYKRAFFDDGRPLGSAENAECQIDAIAQSWSVLSGAAEARRARTAMGAVDRRLVRRDHRLIQLLDPPFDKSDMNPGYIKGYVPGVRENGGQYTHSAIWTVMAFAALGDSQRAWELFGMINPVNHANSAAAIATYKVEPYVVAADVYAVAPHTGRGGWTWYTGSAGWLYRLIVESLLGLRLEVDKLRFAPCLPADWESFGLTYRYRETTYHLKVSQTRAVDGKLRVSVDGAEQQEAFVPLVNDRAEHAVEVTVPRA